jgi:hypothetical protein
MSRPTIPKMNPTSASLFRGCGGPPTPDVTPLARNAEAMVVKSLTLSHEFASQQANYHSSMRNHSSICSPRAFYRLAHPAHALVSEESTFIRKTIGTNKICCSPSEVNRK